MNRKIIFSIAFSLITSNVYCAPVITGLNGSVSIEQDVTVLGANFGVAPNVIIYDEFKGIDGKNISLNATHGSWTSSENPVYITDGDNVSALLVDGTTSKQMQLAFPGVQEIFISYKVKIPFGYHFPNTATTETFAPDSAWKLAWIMDGSSGYKGDDDICLPTFPNGTYFSLSGNDTGIKLNGVYAGPEVGRPGTTSNWFSFKGWNRVSTYLKAGDDPVADTGIIWLQGLSEEFGIKTFFASNRTLFDGDDNDNDNGTSQWSFFRLSGWHRTGGVNSAYDTTTRAIYDDVYIATGPNAAARVEIGNNAIYASCTKLAIATPKNWGDTSITITVRGGGFFKGEQVYLFVIDANNVASAGYGPVALSAPMIRAWK